MNRAALVLAGLVLAAPAWAGSVTMKSKAETSGPYVRLGEVAEVVGDPLWENIFLGPAPAAGESKVLSREAVRSRLAYLGVPAEVGGAEQTELRLSGRPGARAHDWEADLKGEIDRRLRLQGWALGQSVLDLPAGWTQADVGEVSRVPEAGGEVSVRLRGKQASGESEEKSLLLSVIKIRKVVVALRALKPGQTVASDDVGVREIPEAKAALGAMTDASLCVGRRVQAAVPAEGVLMASALQLPRVVSRGMACILSERDGRIRIQCQGTALADGRVGDLIPFEVVDSKKVVRAQVRAEGEADLRLEEEP